MAKLEPHPLMRTIVDHPDADLPRLVYADWLDEQGDPKMALLAEYIRLSIELESLPQQSKERKAVQDQLSKVTLLEDGYFVHPLPPMPKWARNSLTLHRGLPRYLSCTIKRFSQGGAGVLEFAPITAVGLSNIGDVERDATYAPAALARKELIRVRGLHVMGPLSALAFEALATNPNVTNLQRLSLTLTRSPLPDDGAAALAAASDKFANLTELSISGNPISARARRALTKAFGERVELSTYH